MGRPQPLQDGPEKEQASEEKVSAGLGRLGKAADGLRHAYLDVRVEGTSMVTADLVAKHTALQSVELPGNDLRDVSALSRLKHMTRLDVSGNKLERCPELDPPPSNLRTLSLAGNAIAALSGLSGLRRLTELRVDANQLEQLEGIGSLPSLRVLSAAENRLASCQGLEQCTALRRLFINSNAIDSLAPLTPLRRLEVLHIASNRLSSLRGLEEMHAIIELDARNNLIMDLEEVRFGRGLQNFRSLNVSGNDVCSYRQSRLHIVYLMPQLFVLNDEEVLPAEKVQSLNLHGADAEVLKQIRRKHFPDGELDDGGGAIVPVSAGLLAATASHAKDDGETFSEADAFAKEITAEMITKGVDSFGNHIIKRLSSQLAIARACWTWLLQNAVKPPDSPCRVGSHVLCEDMRPVEDMFLPEVGNGTYAERIARIYMSLCRACQLEANDILGYWKHGGLLPGTWLASHNHCWNAVKVNGRWRLLDLFWALKEMECGNDVPFYASPEAFIHSHFPIEEWWQLIDEYITVEQFWDLPNCSLFFFTKGFSFETQGISAVNVVEQDQSQQPEFQKMPIIRLALERPKPELVIHELLDESLSVVSPGEGLGSFTFTQVESKGPEPFGGGQEEAVVQHLWASFPKPGNYFLRTRLIRGPEVLMLKYVVPAAACGTPVRFPSSFEELVSRGCQVISPDVSHALRSDMTYNWEVFAPGATWLALVCQEGSKETQMAMEPMSDARFCLEYTVRRSPVLKVCARFDGTDHEVVLLTYPVLPEVLDVAEKPIKASSGEAGTVTKSRWKELFRSLDLDKDGNISPAELAAGLREMPQLKGLLGILHEAGGSLHRKQLSEIFMDLDSCRLGRISWKDFATKLQKVMDSRPHVHVNLHLNDDGRVQLQVE
uniref:Leucine-rich repeat and guanylate kinase domain-containing protein n=1 Tax=Tetraselmis sp. GSL018 TaxID=582737 RepID=A0A061QPX4_9CHLO